MEKGIHILGLGNMGKYIAHGLMRARSMKGQAAMDQFPPVTLLFHRPGLLTDWNNAGCAISYAPIDGVAAKSTLNPPLEKSHAKGFRIELLNTQNTSITIDQRQPDVLVDCSSPIKHLIVATKAYATTAALAPIRHRLGRDSHIMFLQNGMGVTDDVSQRLFPDSDSRPTYWAGICSAGVYNQGPFSIVHAGRGPLRFGVVGVDGTRGELPKEGNSFVDELMQTHVLEPELLTPKRILEAQLEKLVVNSVINPLTALFDCKNGDVFSSEAGVRERRALVLEAGAIVREVLRRADDSSPERGFSDAALQDVVTRVAEATANNTSSMLQDIRAGRPTEIDFINGYLARQGELLGLPCQRHRDIVALVKGRVKETESLAYQGPL